MTLKRLLIIGLLVFGIYARFSGVDQKVYSLDEVRGLLRASGVTSQYFVSSVYTGEPIVNSELQKYQTAELDRPLGDAINAFANNPEHPPLYYLLMRFSLQLFNHASASRGVAIGFSLLLLPAVYWLCQELFIGTAISSAAVGWSTIVLIAVSPFQVLLAQEARQYTVWAVLTVVSSALLLRLLRQNRDQSKNREKTQQQAITQDSITQDSITQAPWLLWLGYGITAALGMYAHLFFAWVLLTHGLYVFLTEKFRFTQKLRRYVMASIGVSLAFSPWVWVVLTRVSRLGKTTKWASTYDSSLLGRADVWLHNIGIGFIDLDWPARFINPFSYLVLAIVIYSIYQLCRQMPRRVWLFVVLLMAVTAMAQIVPDLLLGGRRSLLSRYSLTVYLGMELAVGYAIALAFPSFSKDSGSKDGRSKDSQNKDGLKQSGTSQGSFSHYLPNHRWLNHLWLNRSLLAKGRKVGAIALILGGLVSSGMVTQSLTWAKGTSQVTAKASPLINQGLDSGQSRFVLTDVDHTYTLSLSHQVSPDTRFVLVNREQSPDYAAAMSQIPENSDFFVYAPSAAMLEFLQTADDVSLLPQTRDFRLAQLYQVKRDRRYLSRGELSKDDRF